MERFGIINVTALLHERGTRPNVLPIIASLQDSGVVDLRGLAGALNARGIRIARGRCWHVSNVKNVIDRTHRQRLL